jgi:hypothetical protein
VGKEALIAILCVLAAFALVAVGLGTGTAPERATARQDAVFAGGPDAGAPEPASRPRTGRRRTATPPAGDAVVRIRRGRSAVLHSRPGGRELVVLRERTPFGSSSVLPVVRRRPGWLGVLSSSLPSGTVGWIRDDRRALAPGRTGTRVIVDRSERRLTVVRRGRRVLTAAVGLGRPGSETPAGRFAITDKLPGSRYSSSYGCCILALSGRQANLPAGWRGGDRLAIHGTVGRSATSDRSAGCVTVEAAPLRRLMTTVPLGTVVTVRP